MADITVRKIRFEFDADFELEGSDAELSAKLRMIGISLTMPYLEPYLIRTMKLALERIQDPGLTEDVRRFSQQEGHHFRNHAVYNERVRARFEADVAAELRATEQALDADYKRYSRTKSLRFNVTYAEGFEAMTCSLALAMAQAGNFASHAQLPGGEMWAWHMAEEIEHRTVAFGVYEHLVGSYPYRLLVGTWSQWHYLRYVERFARSMAKALGRKLVLTRSEADRLFLRNYLRTWSPRYHPAKIQVPAGVHALLERYSEIAEGPQPWNANAVARTAAAE